MEETRRQEEENEKETEMEMERMCIGPFRLRRKEGK